MPLIDETGNRYGRLTVLYRVEGCSGTKWMCKCDCGNYVEVFASALRTGKTRSCKCLLSESTKDRATKYKIHNKRLYRIWYHMILRCENRNDIQYKNYGERGIKVCKEWQGFDNFAEWAINNGYKERLTIDRINVNGNYEPENCRWATMKQQLNNTRTNVFITSNGLTKTLTEWSEYYNIDSKKLKRRLDNNVPFEEAVEELVSTRGKRKLLCISTNEIFNTAREAERKYGTSYGAIAHAAVNGKTSVGMKWKYIYEQI